MYVYMCVYVHTHVCVCIHTHSTSVLNVYLFTNLSIMELYV